MQDLGVLERDAGRARRRERGDRARDGARRAARSGADIAVAVSGIAGPDGGQPGKPVGTVWFAPRHWRAAATRSRRASRRQLFAGDREAVRRSSVEYALELILQHALPQDAVTAEPTRRLFFALWPDERMQAALADATRTHRRRKRRRAQSPPRNFHRARWHSSAPCRQPSRRCRRSQRKSPRICTAGEIRPQVERALSSTAIASLASRRSHRSP